MSRPHWPRSQLLHTSCLVPIGHELSYAIPAVSSPLATISATLYPLSRPHWLRSQLRHTSCLVPIGHELSYSIPAHTYISLAVPVPLRSQLKHLYTVSPIHKMCSRPQARLNTCSDANTPPPAPGPIYRYIVLGCGSFVRGRKRKKGDSIPFILSRRDYMPRLPDEATR